ncbi:cysteine hydrolase [Fictibacillus nanhaiensis]|uniref:cysteine hydrolase family protein n=1 Tax=Fictibacillus nanhaiensis TaxID=742169 RepID=UPI001C94A7A3|nr:cysteine hydrolase [Fictibacillus nanhaiensis]MBY6035970.1 cysteine hydrolase [Fictibacillus nanhaiensis]
MSIALLVLDIQKGFIGDKARMPVAKHQIEPMLERVNEIVEKADSQDIPVVYIGNEYESNQFIVNFLTKNSALKGSEGAELDDRLLRVNDLYFSKNKGSALSNLELVSYLISNEIKHIVIVGLFTEACVASTALDSIRRNFTVTVVRDAVASSNDAKREKALKFLNNKGITVMDSTKFIELFRQ